MHDFFVPIFILANISYEHISCSLLFPLSLSLFIMPNVCNFLPFPCKCVLFIYLFVFFRCFFACNFFHSYFFFRSYCTLVLDMCILNVDDVLFPFYLLLSVFVVLIILSLSRALALPLCQVTAFYSYILSIWIIIMLNKKKMKTKFCKRIHANFLFFCLFFFLRFFLSLLLNREPSISLWILEHCPSNTVRFLFFSFVNVVVAVVVYVWVTTLIASYIFIILYSCWHSFSFSSSAVQMKNATYRYQK